MPFLSGGGEMGAFIRAHDWTRSPLGAPERWSTVLQTAVSLMLHSAAPVYVAWGDELISLYNDTYLPIVGAKHPGIGKPFAQLWAEIWSQFRPIVEATMAGDAQHFVDLPIPLAGRPGLPVGYFTFSYTPLRDETGKIAGLYCAATETTDKVLADRRTLEQAKSQRTMFDGAPGFICTMRGPLHVFEFVNEAHRRLFDSANWIGKPVQEAFPDIAGQGFHELLDQVYRTGERVTRLGAPARYRRVSDSDETLIYMDFVYAPIIEEDQVVGIFCEGQDVTAAHTVREALRESEERYREIVEGADDFAIIALDASGGITGWNKGAERMMGFSDAEVLGQYGAIFFTPEDRDDGAPEREISLAREHGRAVNERWHMRKDGSRFWGSGLLMRQHQDGGGYLKIFRDRTAEHQAEVALRDREYDLQVMADSLPLLISYVDRDEVYRFVNAAYQDWFGKRSDELIGRHLKDVIGDAVYLAVTPKLRRALAGEAFSFEHVMPYRTGGERWLYVDYVPRLSASGDVEGFYAVLQDITERKKAEQRRLALVEFSDRIRASHGANEVANAAAEILGRTLDVSRVGYATIDPDAETLHVDRDWNAPGIASLAGVQQLDDYGSLIESLKRGEFVAIGDARDDARTASASHALESRSARSFVNVPIIEQERLAAVLYVNHATARNWTAEERALIREMAERARTAMERLRAETDLHVSEESLRLAVAAADVGTWDLDLTTDILTWSDRTKAAFGISADVACSMKDFYCGLHPDDLAMTSDAFASALDPDRRASYDVEYRTIGKEDGVVRWVAAKGVGLFDRDGRCLRALGTAIDITARKRADEELRRLNETLEQRVVERTAERDRMWNTSPDLMVEIDFKGIFRRLNPAWTVTLGYAPDQLVGRHVNDFVIAEDHAKTSKAYQFAAHGGQPTIENRLRHKDGSIRWISWVAAPAGDMVYVTGRDITSDKDRAALLEAAQEQLRQSQKMEAMGSLTGGVAHDFNNLLTPIVGSLDMLQRKGLDGEREQRLVARAILAADRAKTLVQRLLAFARRQPLQPTSVDLAPLVRGMAELVSSTTGPQIKVVVDAAEGLPLANADPNQLEMAILNLAVNARDAMPHGGTLRISVDAEMVGPHHRAGVAPGPYMRLSVADTGTGMDSETLQRAVEPFFSTKGIGKGTGLGLSMVHGLASQLGGALTIRSAPGIGTNVELWLPQSSQLPSADPPVEGVMQPDAGKGTALLVDDEDLVRFSTADMLTELGYSVVEASSAEDALRLVNAGLHPDLLVTDHLMPGMSGTELARALLAGQPGMKVLVVSGYADVEGIAPDLARLTKPFRHHDLAAGLAALG
ncbi:PAS domain S-box protein [uncultured Devosia sp.]|uniref:PAS domain S-box protein n=1 Tax=uncultured Devosia sp. TaxID=211434 RepID=UPI0035CBA27A